MTTEQAQALIEANQKLQEKLAAMEEKYNTEVTASATFRKSIEAKLDTIVSGGKVTRDEDKDEQAGKEKQNKSPQQIAAERRAGK